MASRTVCFLVVIFLVLGCNSRNDVSSQDSGLRHKYSIEEIMNDLSILNKINSNEISETFLFKEIPNTFGNNYSGAHGGIALFNNSNTVIGFLDFYYTETYYIILLSQKTSNTVNKIVDVKVIDRTSDNKLLSASGMYNGKYEGNMIVITSASLDSDWTNSTDHIFIFDMQSLKIIDIQGQDVEVFSET